jgi:hypothetical protein
MKKLSIVILISLLLTGCFKDKTEIAIENCADEKVDYVTLYISTPLFDHFSKNKKYKKISEDLEQKEKDYKFNLSKFEIFVKSNYRNNEYILSHYKDYHYGIEKDLKHPNANYDYQFKSQKDIFGKSSVIFESEALAEIVFDSKIQARAQSLKLAKFVKDKFSKENLKTKFLLKRYANYYKKCELEYNRTPKTFVAKWSNK